MSYKNPNRKRVRGVYLYTTESGEYVVDLVLGRNKIVKRPLQYKNRTQMNEFIENLIKDEDKRFMVSKLGIKIYNKEPEERLLIRSKESILETYVKNLRILKENDSYKKKVANLLRSVSDLIDDDDKGGLNSTSVMPSKDPELNFDTPAIDPKNPIEPSIPMELVLRVQDSLDVHISFENLTFWFQNQKWQLTKDGHEFKTPEMPGSKTGKNILNTMDYMSTLLGVNAEKNKELGSNSFTFVDQGNVYRITHIYTGDHNTIRREI